MKLWKRFLGFLRRLLGLPGEIPKPPEPDLRRDRWIRRLEQAHRHEMIPHPPMGAEL